jgi:hypothetical protein
MKKHLSPFLLLAALYFGVHAQPAIAQKGEADFTGDWACCWAWSDPDEKKKLAPYFEITHQGQDLTIKYIHGKGHTSTVLKFQIDGEEHVLTDDINQRGLRRITTQRATWRDKHRELETVQKTIVGERVATLRHVYRLESENVITDVETKEEAGGTEYPPSRTERTWRLVKRPGS